jgi:nucleoside-diphosphate-sugar epimerase
MAKPQVLLTGASGSMGHEAFLELRRRSDRYDTRLLLRPSKVNEKMFAPYAGESWLDVVWGDLTSPEDVDRAVSGVDYVLHPAAMISPAADRYPQAARQINVGAIENLLAAIRKQPDGAERIGLVNIGSVAQYGDRLPPIEMIKVGDPLKPSWNDYYALTKCEAETLVIESGLSRWASMRQTFICIPNLLSLLDPILFHQPLDQHFEFITSRDAGYGLVQTLEAPDAFWGNIYNMSGGPSCRVVYEDFMHRIFSIFGIKDYRYAFERNWFALRNFHCGYFEDSWLLDKHLGHFRDTLDDYVAQVEANAAGWMKLGGRLAPSWLLKRLARRMAEPMDWIESNSEEHIKYFFGSREAWARIPDWDWSEKR